MASCSSIQYKFYRGGWSSWSSSPGGQAGGDNVVVAKFTTPSASPSYNNYTSKTVAINVNWHPVHTFVSFTLYAKKYTSDPTSKAISTLKSEVKSSYDTSESVAAPKNSSYRNVGVTLSGMDFSKTYYVVFWSSATKSYPELNGSGWSFSHSHSGWNNASVSKPKISDNGNGTFSITAYAGTGDNTNTVNSSTLKYKRGSDSWTTAAGLDKAKGISLSCGVGSATQNIQAKVEVVTQRGDNPVGVASSINVNNYQPPYWTTSNPNNKWIELHNDSLKNGRLTIKKLWKFHWGPATKRNDSSQLVGYRIRLYKNGKTIPIKNASGSQLSSLRPTTTDDWIYDRNSTSTEITIDPVLHGFVPGDTVYLGVYAYSKDNNGKQLFNDGGGGEYQLTSSSEPVLNAGVVQVKVGDGWTEGQVWVKTPDGWKEADTVSTKTADGWKESQ
jgi:hypothetical protein